MYVAQHTNQFIRGTMAAQARRPPVTIDFQNEIIERYVRPEGVEEGVERIEAVVI